MFSDGMMWVAKKVLGLIFVGSVLITAAVVTATTKTKVSATVQTKIDLTDQSGNTTSGTETQEMTINPQVSPDLLSNPFSAENWDPILPPFLTTLAAGIILGIPFGLFIYPIRKRGIKETVLRAKVRAVMFGFATVVTLLAGAIGMIVIRDVFPDIEERLPISKRTLITFSIILTSSGFIGMLWGLWAIMRSIVSDDNPE